MRNAILQLPSQGTANEQRQVLRAAMRQLDRAEIYLAAVAYMELDDRPTERAIMRLRHDVEGLKRHLTALRADTSA